MVDLDNVIDAAGLIGDVGGEANSLFLAPSDWTSWQKVATPRTARSCSPTSRRPPPRSSPA